jgi:hypothetical protein
LQNKTKQKSQKGTEQKSAKSSRKKAVWPTQVLKSCCPDDPFAKRHHSFFSYFLEC